MKDLTVFGTIAFVAVVSLLGFMFGSTDDAEIQKQILGYTESLVTFVAGGVAGGVGAGVVGFAKGKGIW